MFFSAKTARGENQFRRRVRGFGQRLHRHVDLKMAPRIGAGLVAAWLGAHEGVGERLPGFFIHEKTDEHSLVHPM